ncbi:MAG: ImmA/IrrE family metallo-endopeptidase [Pyrinomonadaceae bacterium]|jgi:Zn-dependent peptidase ImmA (M78 family)
MGTIGRARQCARSVLKKHKINSLPVDVLGLIGKEALGFRIIYEEDWPDRISGLTNKGQKTIRINKKHHPLRQRFSLAHELGHICLDHDLILSDRIEEEGIKEEFEKEANEFASELLMPIDMFKKAFRTNANLESLADTFLVSTTAVSVRAINLHLI